MFNSISRLFKNEEPQQPEKPLSERVLYINPNRCPQNHRCPSLNVCPTGALTQNGYKLPKVDAAKCTKCGKCVKYCPTRAISLR